MKIAIATDHAGYKLKEKLKEYLESKNYDVVDFGPNTEDPIDYPDTIHPLASAVHLGLQEKGIIICGSGNGVSMVANKYNHVRAAICWNEDITRLARQHNDANIIALPARFITEEQALKFVEIFFEAEFEGGRHTKRVEKIIPEKV